MGRSAYFEFTALNASSVCDEHHEDRSTREERSHRKRSLRTCARTGEHEDHTVDRCRKRSEDQRGHDVPSETGADENGELDVAHPKSPRAEQVDDEEEGERSRGGDDP